MRAIWLFCFRPPELCHLLGATPRSVRPSLLGMRMGVRLLRVHFSSAQVRLHSWATEGIILCRVLCRAEGACGFHPLWDCSCYKADLRLAV